MFSADFWIYRSRTFVVAALPAGNEWRYACRYSYGSPITWKQHYGGVGRGCGVGWGLGVGPHLPVHGVGVGVVVGVAVGLGVGVEPPAAQYLPPVLKS